MGVPRHDRGRSGPFHSRFLVKRSAGEADSEERRGWRAPARLVVNLAACPFVDSAGVAALVSEAQRARQASRALLLVSLRAQVRSVLALARLESLFEIRPTLEDALNDTQQQGAQS